MLKFRKSLTTSAILAGLPLSAFALNNSFTINNIQLAGFAARAAICCDALYAGP